MNNKKSALKKIAAILTSMLLIVATTACSKNANDNSSSKVKSEDTSKVEEKNVSSEENSFSAPLKTASGDFNLDYFVENYPFVDKTTGRLEYTSSSEIIDAINSLTEKNKDRYFNYTVDEDEVWYGFGNVENYEDNDKLSTLYTFCPDEHPYVQHEDENGLYYTEIDGHVNTTAVKITTGFGSSQTGTDENEAECYNKDGMTYLGLVMDVDSEYVFKDEDNKNYVFIPIFAGIDGEGYYAVRPNLAYMLYMDVSEMTPFDGNTIAQTEEVTSSSVETETEIPEEDESSENSETENKISSDVISASDLFRMTKDEILNKIGDDYEFVFYPAFKDETKNGYPVMQYGRNIKGITSKKYFPNVVIDFDQETFNNTDAGQNITTAKEIFENADGNSYPYVITILKGGLITDKVGKTPTKAVAGMSYKDIFYNIDSLGGISVSGDMFPYDTADCVFDGLGINKVDCRIYFDRDNPDITDYINNSEYSTAYGSPICLSGKAAEVPCVYADIARTDYDFFKNSIKCKVVKTKDKVSLMNSTMPGAMEMAVLEAGDKLIIDGYTIRNNETDDECWYCVLKYSTSFGIKQGYIKSQYVTPLDGKQLPVMVPQG